MTAAALLDRQPTRRERIETVRGVNVYGVARAVGIAQIGRALSPCPFCNAAKRHPSRADRRGAIGVRADARGWQCFGCDTTGDGLDLCAGALFARKFRDLDRDQMDQVLDRLDSGRRAIPALYEVAPPAPPRYPPQSEVGALLSATVPVTDDAEVSAYLRHREIDPLAIAELRLAFALPTSAAVPAWARTWGATNHRLVVPLVNHLGHTRSVLARSVDLDPTLKSIAPKGFERRGLIMADSPGLEVLATRSCAAWHAGAAPRVLIREGEIDHLLAATAWSEADDSAPALLSVVSGSWSDDFANRIPPGTEVIVGTDADDAGDQYARRIQETLAERAEADRIVLWRLRA